MGFSELCSKPHGDMRTEENTGYSSIEVENQVYTFFAGDDSHPKWAGIYQYLENLRLEVQASGYVSDTSCVL